MFDHFSFLAPIYDRLFRSKDPHMLLSLLDPHRNDILLDAGGGTGRVGKLLRPYTAQVVVADISYKMLQQTHTKNSLQPVCTPTELLPFPNNSFDRVVMVDALHHVRNAAVTITELWRVTKKHGCILIEEPDIRTGAVIVLAVIEKMLLMRSHFLSPPMVVSLFNRLGAQAKIYSQNNTAWIEIKKPV
jgi:demethylmenaquinone methyltransferase/2-methoxy-6-polyprenyl-1,4-benzoquinol methylase